MTLLSVRNKSQTLPESQGRKKLVLYMTLFLITITKMICVVNKPVCLCRQLRNCVFLDGRFLFPVLDNQDDGFPRTEGKQTPPPHVTHDKQTASEKCGAETRAQGIRGGQLCPRRPLRWLWNACRGCFPQFSGRNWAFLWEEQTHRWHRGSGTAASCSFLWSKKHRRWEKSSVHTRFHHFYHMLL